MQNLLSNRKYIKTYGIVMLFLICFLLLFYFSCGEQLFSRDSGGNIEEIAATNDAGELISGVLVEQMFTSDSDIIQTIGVMATDYDRNITSNLILKLYDETTGEQIAQSVVAGESLGVNQYVYFNLEEPIENTRGHLLRITTESDGQQGNVPTVLYNVENKIESENVAKNAMLKINGIDTQGTLCFTVLGRDRVWTGPNYWKIALLVVIIVSIIYFIAALRHAKGKNDYIFTVYQALLRYKFLIQQLVSRDFKVRYKRSVLGVLWSLLNPLLMMTVQYVVFSQLFKSNIENFPVYLLSGLVVFNFFSEGVSQALTSIVGNASLITKVYMPKYVYPVTRVISSGINLLMSLIPLIVVAAATHEEFTKAYIMLPYFLVCLILFTIGFGMLMSALMVFFRDMQFLWGILSMIWMYLTPLFYPISIIPEKFRGVIENNPMLCYVDSVRSIVMEGVTPVPRMFFECAIVAVLSLAIGGLVFRKTQDKFIFYI